ncbi:MAG: APC family permease [Verrucomicrobiales bacterium]
MQEKKMDHAADGEPHLQRRFGLLQSTALNMSNMIGIGPFITIPLLMSALLGPQSMLGWIIALLITIPDSLIWSELGAAMPGSGGTYVYLKEAYNPRKWGRFMAFMFIWQFILSGPLEIASGYIGFVSYLRYVWPDMTTLQTRVLVTIMGALTIFALYRKIGSIGKITVSLWIGTLLTTGIVIVLGIFNFDPKIAFGFSSPGFSTAAGFLMGLGAATRVGVYDYLGYYDICYIGDEVKNPGKVIPRSILISLISVSAIYLAINLSIIGVVPMSEFIPAGQSRNSDFIVSVFMERLVGPKFATFFTFLVMWTAFGSVFALLLGYSRIPFAAAQDGYFFRIFGKTHPTKKFPHISLLLIGSIAIVCSFFPLGAVIDALVAARILVQFLGQVFAVVAIRRTRPDIVRPFKMWLYPLPCFMAFIGWTFLFVTTDWKIQLGALGFLISGVVCFLIWSAVTKGWPFGNQEPVRS